MTAASAGVNGTEVAGAAGSGSGSAGSGSGSPGAGAANSDAAATPAAPAAAAPSAPSPPAAITVADRPLPRLPGFPEPGDDTGPRRHLAALIDGTAPPTPCLERLGLVIPPATKWSHGSVVLDMELGVELTLTPGVIFGGYITCLIDHLASLVMMTVLPDDTFVLTAGLGAEFLGPVVPGTVRIEAEVTKLATRLATVETTFVQDGRVTTRGTAEQVVKRGIPGRAA